MRSTPILSNTYYHVYNRGNNKQKLFLEKTDYLRFLFILLHYQSTLPVTHINRHISSYIKTGKFKLKENEISDIVKNRNVELLNFCIMPNHFHLTIHNLTEEGLSLYMHRVSNAYAKYFNTKYQKTGHVFQGTYKAKIIDTDKQLHYLSAYIHKNPQELSKWKNRYLQYPWSSIQDYNENRWGKLLNTQAILSTFKSFSEYETFLQTSGAKENLLT